jgi:hypothetical protein
MAIPNDNFVLRLREPKNFPLIGMSVLDVAVTGLAERAALVEWRGSDMAGFSIIRIDPLGNVVPDVAGKLLGKISKTLCRFKAVECGNFRLETGYLLPLSDGFIIAGTATGIFSGEQNPFAVRIDNLGNIRWGRKYVGDVGHPSTAKVTSIIPMLLPNRYLISAINSDDDSLVFQIDGSGTLIDSQLVSDAHIRRMRMTTLGVLGVGEILRGGFNPEPAIFAFTGTDARGLWTRWAIWERELPDHGVRWFDIAEGESMLLVIGNVGGRFGDDSPMMAFMDKAKLPTTTDKIKTYIPTLGTDPVRLRAVVNHQDLVIPLKGGDTFSAFCVTGEVNQQPWKFVIKDDATLLFQKKLRIPDGAKGSEAPVVWASFEEIITGGFVTTNTIPRGFIASSPVTNARGSSMCSAETDVVMKEDFLYAEYGIPAAVPVPMHMTDWSIDEGRDPDILKGCLDAQ